MEVVIMAVVCALATLAVVVVVGIVAFTHIAAKVVGRSHREDLPKVLETVGRTQSGMVGVLSRGVRRMLPTPGASAPATVAEQAPPADGTLTDGTGGARVGSQ
ncbi:hypothetical protein [Streptomyces sp. NPDC016675]|uniref:hypothetical protein n=1 Tax=Streptomyces sp. NPDC016675 TaxID=3364970 RepID=UPI0037008530